MLKIRPEQRDWLATITLVDSDTLSLDGFLELHPEFTKTEEGVVEVHIEQREMFTSPAIFLRNNETGERAVIYRSNEYGGVTKHHMYSY